MQKIILFCLFISIRIGLTAQSLFSDADITSKTINTSLAIGIISGGAAVTNGGDATYNIPISIPSGLNGMNPGISINYNSAASTGLLGYGLSLSAFSSIGYDTKNLYNDNEVAPEYINSAGPYLWNGQRLIPVNGTNIEFKTEQETYAKITCIGSVNPTSFTVITKDGMTLEYGTDSDSKISTSSGKPIRWLLKNVINNLGSSIEYSYQKLNNEVVLTKITYTKNPLVSTLLNNTQVQLLNAIF